jgi:hypothetical protein
MKHFVKENWFKILLIVFVIGMLVLLNSNKEYEIKMEFIGSDLSTATQITCTYSQVLNVKYNNSLISHNIPESEMNPIIFTFSELQDPEVSKMSYVDSTRTISTLPVVKLLENDEKIIYADGTGENYFSIHTIYKEHGVSTYTKNVNIFGIPSGTLAMGSCVGY